MGVEPTAACSAQPATGFEDRGAHRDTTTPVNKFSGNGRLCHPGSHPNMTTAP